MLKIEILRAFCTVVQSGNLNTAADTLGRTPGAVSMALKQLENHLGQSLFAGERKSVLSPLGEEVFALAQRQVREFDETVSAIETTAKAPRGLIRIASVPSVAGLVFPQVLTQMRARHPQVQIDLRDSDSSQVVEALMRGQVDIGIVSGTPKLNGARAIPLFSDRFGVTCAEHHKLARRHTDPELADLMRANLINNALCARIETPSFRSLAQQAPVSVHNTLSLIAMVRKGDWVTLLPESVAEFAPQGVVFRAVLGLSDRRDVTLFVRERTPYPELCDELVGLVRDEVGNRTVA